MEVRQWQHPAVASIISTDENEGNGSMHIYTGGSKTAKRVESGPHTKSKQRRLNKRCTNNQAEQLAILAALQHIEKPQRTDKTITIYTESKITLEKLQNSKIHTCITKELRLKIIEMNKTS